jgi:hypothetical protein
MLRNVVVLLKNLRAENFAAKKSKLVEVFYLKPPYFKLLTISYLKYN